MLWGMQYADDAGIVSRPSRGLERILTGIGTAGASFGLTVSGGQDGDDVPANEISRKCVVQRHQKRLCVQTNGRVCVLGRGSPRKPGSQCRDSASAPEEMGVLRVVFDGNL